MYIKLHVNAIILCVDVIKLAYKGQNYGTLGLSYIWHQIILQCVYAIMLSALVIMSYALVIMSCVEKYVKSKLKHTVSW